MKSLGTLILIFVAVGLITPLFSNIRYHQLSRETDCTCEAVGDLPIPCTKYEGEGYIFATYLVNVHYERSGTRIPKCTTEQLHNISSFSFSFMEWPGNSDSSFLP